MSEIFNKAVEQADKLSTQDNVLDVLYGKTEEAYEKFEKESLLKQLALSMTPGIGNVIAAKEVDVFGGRAGEAFEKDEWGKAAGYGGLTALAALGTLPGVGILGRGVKTAIRSGAKLLDDPMEKAIKEVGEKATLPKTPSRVFGKELDEYTGPHSDFVPERGLKDLDELRYEPFTKVDDTQDVLTALNRTEDDIVKFTKSTSKGGQKLTKAEKEIYRNTELEKQARLLDADKITFDVFKKMRDSLKPLKTYGRVPKLFDDFDILGSIGDKVKRFGIIGVNRNLKADELVNTRFDINAYKNYGRYVVTVSKGKKVFGYAPTAILKNVKFGGNIDVKETKKIYDMGEKSFDIARGIRKVKGKKEGTKHPFAVMEGKWQDVSPESTQKYAQELMDADKVNKAGETHKLWTEIGFDPSARTSFYNRSTGEPIFGAEKVIQVGPMLLARGIKKSTKEQLKGLRFKIKSGKELEGYKQGGQIVTGLDDKVLYRKEGGLSSINEPININGQPHNLAWINPDEASVLRDMGGSGRKIEGIPAYFYADQGDYAEDTSGVTDTSQDSSDDQPIRGMSPQEKADMINRALEGRGDTSLWKNPDTETVHKIEEPKQVEEEPDDRSWFARILESVGESLLYFLTGGAVDYEHSGKDMIGGDITRWGEQQPKGTVDLSLPSVAGLASMVTPTFNVGVPGQSDKAMSMVETPVTRLLSPLFTGNKDTESKFISRDAQRRHGLDALKKKRDAELLNNEG